MELINILTIILLILIFITLILVGIYFIMVYKNKRKKEEEESAPQQEKSTYNGMPRESIYSFMEFDDIKDGMIVRKNGEQYVMVIQCQGVNYDLLSEQEKIAVEEGFLQLLNTLRFPIQLYIQTRSLNLKDIVDEYKKKVDVFRKQIDQIEIKLRDAQNRGDEQLIQNLEFERRRKKNVLEYGMDITDYVSRLSLNKNVLQQKTYIVVSYYAAEFGTTNTYGKDEISNICFSELYTRCQSIIRLLASSEVGGRILDSEELAELLYVAYNRDGSEVLQLSKALDAQYDALYSTSKTTLDKKKEKLDREIEQQAVDLVTDTLIEADKKQAESEEQERMRLLQEKSLALLEEYKDSIDPDIYEEAVKQVQGKTSIKKKSENSKEEKIEEVTKMPRKNSRRKTTKE